MALTRQPWTALGQPLQEREARSRSSQASGALNSWVASCPPTHPSPNTPQLPTNTPQSHSLHSPLPPLAPRGPQLTQEGGREATLAQGPTGKYNGGVGRCLAGSQGLTHEHIHQHGAHGSLLGQRQGHSPPRAGGADGLMSPGEEQREEEGRETSSPKGGERPGHPRQTSRLACRLSCQPPLQVPPQEVGPGPHPTRHLRPRPSSWSAPGHLPWKAGSGQDQGAWGWTMCRGHQWRH